MNPVPMSDQRVDEVLDRLGFVQRPPLDADGLHALYSAWCRSVPFDNLQKLLALDADAAELPGMDADAFFASWIADGTGGTCWPSNNALHALLTSAGFDAVRWGASMFDGPMNHGTTIVTVGSQRFIVDTAIHGDIPAPLIEGQTTTVRHGGYPTVVRTDDAGFLFDHPTPDPDFVIPCRVLDPLTYSETLDANEQSRGWSPFNTGIMAGINDNDGVWMLKDTNLARIDSSGVTNQTLTAAETDDFLVDIVGCSPAIVAQIRSLL